MSKKNEHVKPEGFTVSEAIEVLKTMPQNEILYVGTECCSGKAVSINIDAGGTVGIDSYC